MKGTDGESGRGVRALRVDYAVVDRDLLGAFPPGSVDHIKGVTRRTLWVSGTYARTDSEGEVVAPKFTGSTIAYVPKPYHGVSISRPEVVYNYDLVKKTGTRAWQCSAAPSRTVAAPMVGFYTKAASDRFRRVPPPAGKTFLGATPICHQVPPAEQAFIECGGDISGYNVTLYATRRGAIDRTTTVTSEAVSATTVCVKESLFEPEAGIRWR